MFLTRYIMRMHLYVFLLAAMSCFGGTASAQVACEKLVSLDNIQEERTTRGDPAACSDATTTSFVDPFVGVNCTREADALKCRVSKPAEQQPDVVRCGHLQTPRIKSFEDMTGEAVISLWSVRTSCTSEPPTHVAMRKIHLGLGRAELCYRPGICVSLRTLEPANWARLIALGADATMREILKGIGGLPGMKV